MKGKGLPKKQITRSPNRYRSKVNLSESKQTPVRRRTPTRLYNEHPHTASPNFNTSIPQTNPQSRPSKPIERMVVDVRQKRNKGKEHPASQDQLRQYDSVMDSRPLNPLRNYDDSPPLNR